MPSALHAADPGLNPGEGEGQRVEFGCFDKTLNFFNFDFSKLGCFVLLLGFKDFKGL